MHKLFREVRFSINPFGSESGGGVNAYASRPSGDGLSLYLSLGVELSGPVESATGFVVNVSEIDRQVRAGVVPVFSEHIRGMCRRQEAMRFGELAELLKAAAGKLSPFFPASKVSRLVLQLNPFRSLTFIPEEASVLVYSEKFEFAAMHRLWNEAFSEQENFAKFGKCANPRGHGHNYVLEVSVAIPAGEEKEGWIAGFEQIVKDEFVELVDHKNLNEDVADFATLNPTVENIVQMAWNRLNGKFPSAKLRKVTVWENDRTSCTVEG